MKIVIIGVGTTAMIVADIISESHNFTLAGFIGTHEEAEKLARSRVYGNVPFLGDRSILQDLKAEGINGFISAIGNNEIREKAYYEALQAGLIPINAVSKKASINPDVSMGKGIVISPGVVISHGATLEDNILLDPSVIIDVDSVVGSNCYSYPGVIICGGCTIERNVTLRAGVIVEPGVKIGKNQDIAAGTVVSKNLERLHRRED
jgi:sugar O-acyltransferase (sialic acid O-acetyltransferase NeuD family)